MCNSIGKLIGNWLIWLGMDSFVTREIERGEKCDYKTLIFAFEKCNIIFQNSTFIKYLEYSYKMWLFFAENSVTDSKNLVILNVQL